MVEVARTRNARLAMEEALGAPGDLSIPRLSINGLMETLRAPSELVITNTDFGPRDPFLQVFSLWDRLEKARSLGHILVFQMET